MVWQEALGFIGGALTTLGFVPQVVRLFRLKSAREISLPFSVLFLIGVTCWMTYGIALRLPSVIIWNSLTMVLSVAMLYAKLKYGKN